MLIFSTCKWIGLIWIRYIPCLKHENLNIFFSMLKFQPKNLTYENFNKKIQHAKI